MKNISFIIIFTFLFSLILAKPAKRNSSVGLHVEGSKLFDGEGNEFVFRGVNLPHNWFADKTEFSMKEIAALGTNSARIVLGSGDMFTKNDVQDVETVIHWCEEIGLVCVFEIHDFTGSDKPTDITENAIAYWKDFKDLFNAHKDYAILNIANEWMAAWDQSDLWAETYATAIKTLRDIGFEGAIMVDTSGYGQEAASLITHAPKVLEADPNKNIIFSCHVYAALGKDDETLLDNFNKIKANGVCWIVGEFGWWHYGSDVAYKTLLSYTAANNIGWISWSWAGNAGIDNILDLTSPDTFAKEDLTDWGKFVFYSEYGVQNTSKLAYGKVNDVILNTNPEDAKVFPVKEPETTTTTAAVVDVEIQTPTETVVISATPTTTSTTATTTPVANAEIPGSQITTSPSPASENSGEYTGCSSTDYACKSEMATKCYSAVSECWNRPYTPELAEECNALQSQCQSIYN